MSVDKRAPNLINTTLLPNPGPYLARIVSNTDPMKQGSLEVELLRPIGNQKEATQQLFVVRYLSPFYGCTSVDFMGASPSEFNDTQKSYGFWAVPPDVGVTVMVIFVDSDPGQGFWMGCVQDAYMNYMIPGIAGSTYPQDQLRVSSDTDWLDVTGTESHFGTTFLPVGEVNRQIFKMGSKSPNPDVEANKKPVHPIAERLLEQGTINDPYRGVHTSSARRESPSNVYGWSTPGPIDKRNGAKKGMVGRDSQKINKFVSRMGGHCIVMDDGDERFLRKSRPWEGPPEYADLEKGESGLVDFPKDEAFRIRTRRGAQILLHSSEDFVYITNSRGTAWMEFTSNGKIEFYAAEGVHMSSGADIQMTAGRHIAQQVYGNHVTNVSGNTVNATSGDHSVKVTGSSFHHTENDHSTMAGNHLYSEGQSGNHLRGDSINFTGTSYEWTIAGNLLLNVQGNFEVRSQNALITSDMQTHILSGSDTRIAGRDLHLLAGHDVVINGYNDINVNADSKITMASGTQITQKTPLIVIQGTGAIALKAAGGGYMLQSAGTLVSTSSGNTVINSGSEVHFQDGNKYSVNDAPSTPYPAREPIEADQATGAPGMQTAGGGYSTLISPNCFPAEGWGSCINKRVPTWEPFQHENLNPANVHVRLLNMDDKRTVVYPDGKQFTIRTVQDLDGISNSYGGYSGGRPDTSKYSRHDAPNLANSYNSKPLDSNYTDDYPPNWTKDREFLSKAQQIAQRHGCTLAELLSVFAAEAGFTMNPSIQNRYGYTGLIQFGNSAAASVGTTTGALRSMTRAQQLDYVEKYFQKNGNPQGVEQIYLSIAAPAKMKIPEGQEIYPTGGKAWAANPGWREYPNGPITKRGLRQFIGSKKGRVERMLQSAGINSGGGPSYPTSPSSSGSSPSGSGSVSVGPTTPPLVPSQQVGSGTNPK